MQIQCKCNANSVHILCKCDANAMTQTPLRPHICHLPAPAPSGPERGRCQIPWLLPVGGCWLAAGRRLAAGWLSGLAFVAARKVREGGYLGARVRARLAAWPVGWPAGGWVLAGWLAGCWPSSRMGETWLVGGQRICSGPPVLAD